MPYQTKPLPFTKALEGISEKTISIHHDKLYAGYVAKANEITDKLVALRQSGNAAGNATYSELRALKDAETFAVNAVYLHEIYFECLGGDGDTTKAPELSKALTEKWGSLDAGLAYFTECAMSARGWSILAWDANVNELKHYNADLHNQGGVWGAIPVIVLDCYEHAYFIDFGADKKSYLQAVWKNFNWSKAEELFLAANKILSLI